MSRYSIAIIVALVLSIIAFVGVLYVLRRRGQYTREKFAFTALTAFIAFAGTIATSIVGNESPWTAVINLLRAIQGLPKEPVEPRPTDHILLVLVLGIVGVFIYRLYRDWGGAISTEEHKRDLFQSKPMLLRDGLDEGKRIVQRRVREKYSASDSRLFFGPLDIPNDSLEWYLQALDLITLRYPSYHFNLDKGYHPEGRCWIGDFEQTKQTVAILCAPHPPGNSEITDFITYVKQVKKPTQIPEDLIAIVVIKEGSIPGPLICGGLTLRIYTEQGLLDDLVDFTDYFEYLERRVEREYLPDSDKTIEMVYAPSACVAEASQQSHSNVESVLDSWLGEAGQRQLALLGEYGQGKSTTALMFAHHLIIRSDRKPTRVPILIELRGRSPRNTTPEGLMAEWAYNFSRIKPKAVMKLIVAGRAVVILEGFDEMALAGDAQARYAHFRTLWGFAYPQSKVLFTGRPNYFLDDRELKSALNIERSAATGPYCESLRLEPFGIAQIQMALRSYPNTTRTEIIDLANSNSQFREVASRGSLLYVIGELWNRADGLGQYGENINSALVIGAFIRSTYERQASKWRATPIGDKRSRQLADFMVLNSAERSYFMTAIACHMARSGLLNQISSRELQGITESIYKVIPDEISAQVSVTSKEPSQPLRKRMESADSVLESIVTDVRTCGLLVNDSSQPASLKFAHKSFMEYLIAEAIADRYFEDYRVASSSISNSFWVTIRVLAASSEILGFSAEILANRVRKVYKSADQATQLRRMILRETEARVGVKIFSIYLDTFLTFTSSASTFQLGQRDLAIRFSQWLLYVASCAAAGKEPESSWNPLEREILSTIKARLGASLPHLARHAIGSGSPALESENSPT